MFDAQSMDSEHTEGNLFSSFISWPWIFPYKDATYFGTILSGIQDDMKTKLTDNHINNSIMYPNVCLLYPILGSICFLYRIFDNEKLIIPKDRMYNVYDDFLISVLRK